MQLNYERYMSGALSFALYNLPATSPANTIKFESLAQRYDEVLLPWLQGV